MITTTTESSPIIINGVHTTTPAHPPMILSSAHTNGPVHPPMILNGVHTSPAYPHAIPAITDTSPNNVSDASALQLEPRLPITFPTLKALLSCLNPDTHPDHLAVYAACCIAYFGCLRGSEFTSADGNFNPLEQISRRDVRFIPTFDEATRVVIEFPFYKPVAGHVHRLSIPIVPGDSACPVAALKRYLGTAGSDQEGALFKCADGTPLGLFYFMDTLRQAIADAGISPVGFDANSFRRNAHHGAAGNEAGGEAGGEDGGEA
ncbi:hypothetical protein Hypma_002265 [Hypsizygus marmoreus]|uniref:Tyr recombinase domain-containing protein n=1 Tax=Hypsizygus marmoreus TaxID=39966 RepID=A0A369K8A0_HYPMA|nr:hypothetical protein Hypma_002265 [Hypsizygus marmoreus]